MIKRHEKIYNTHFNDNIIVINYRFSITRNNTHTQQFYYQKYILSLSSKRPQEILVVKVNNV